MLEEFKEKLIEYLEISGYESKNGQYHCVNPEHEDSNPSAKIFTTSDGSQNLKCFSCGWYGDIFHVAGIVDNLPTSGPLFFNETLPALSKKLGILYTPTSLTSEQKERNTHYRVYSDASKYIVQNKREPSQQVLKELEKRKWTDLEKCNDLGMGWIDSFQGFIDFLLECGHSKITLEQTGMYDPFLFNENRLFFCINDEKDNTIGFIARNLIFDGVKEEDSGRLINGPKYIFNKNPTYRITRKESRLYLLNKAVESDNQTLYILEGQADAFAFHYNNISNVVALGGVELSVSHLETLRKCGIYDIVVCLDGDKAGRLAMQKVLDNTASVHDIRIRFTFLPVNEEKLDPELMVREGRIEEFLALPKLTSFEIILEQNLADETIDSETFVNILISYIVKEPSSVRRSFMIKTLSEASGIQERVITDDVERILSYKDQKVLKVKESIVEDLKKKISSTENLAEVESSLKETLNLLESVDEFNNTNVIDSSAQVGMLLDVKKYQESEENKTFGFTLPKHLETFANVYDGDISQKVIWIPSGANVGS